MHSRLLFSQMLIIALFLTPSVKAGTFDTLLNWADKSNEHKLIISMTLIGAGLGYLATYIIAQKKTNCISYTFPW